jgi:hypothetical protein
MYNVFGFSLPPIKTNRYHITEKLLSMAKILNNQSIIIVCTTKSLLQNCIDREEITRL